MLKKVPSRHRVPRGRMGHSRNRSHDDQ
jgi:hypothetical protein